jgi:hypothetical protein
MNLAEHKGLPANNLLFGPLMDKGGIPRNCLGREMVWSCLVHVFTLWGVAPEKKQANQTAIYHLFMRNIRSNMCFFDFWGVPYLPELPVTTSRFNMV